MKHLIFIVAYNHENFIAKVLDRLPETVKNSNYEILVIDDASKDQTFNKAKNWSELNSGIYIKVLKNPTNLGYGGNQKLGFQYAIENNFDTLVLLHGDGQYAPEIIAPATNPSEIPSTWPMPIRAIPTVAIVDHELPEASDTIAQIKHDAIKKYSGFKICKP